MQTRKLRTRTCRNPQDTGHTFRPSLRTARRQAGVQGGRGEAEPVQPGGLSQQWPDKLGHWEEKLAFNYGFMQFPAEYLDI